MRYLFYFIITYLLLPLNTSIDFISILLYFIVLNEDEKFALIFSCIIGLLLDLYHPVSLGSNMLAFVVLAQGIIFIKKYFLREPVSLIIVFFVFYLFRMLIVYIIPGRMIMWNTFILTLIFCLPILFLLQKIFFKVWIRS